MSENQQINAAACYYPTNVTFIDDNRRFLESLSLVAHQIQVPFQLYNDPTKALVSLNQSQSSESFLSGLIAQTEDDLPETPTLSIDIKSICKEVYNPLRFTYPSVVVVDYAMPAMDGLEVCRNLNNNYLKKVLLTGEADTEIAVAAFNEGIIHQFIMKDSPTLMEHLQATIKDLQKSYFSELTQSIMSSVTASHTIPSCLLEPEFLKLFESLVEEYNIVEYYLLDGQGSYLLLDAEANPMWLLVKSKDEVEGYYDMAKYSDTPDNVLSELREHKSIVYFHTDTDMQVAPSGWSEYLYPAQELHSGQSTYYYSIITDKKVFSLDKDQILSFDAYLDKMG